MTFAPSWSPTVSFFLSFIHSFFLVVLLSLLCLCRLSSSLHLGLPPLVQSLFAFLPPPIPPSPFIVYPFRYRFAVQRMVSQRQRSGSASLRPSSAPPPHLLSHSEVSVVYLSRRTLFPARRGVLVSTRTWSSSPSPPLFMSVFVTRCPSNPAMAHSYRSSRPHPSGGSWLLFRTTVDLMSWCYCIYG